MILITSKYYLLVEFVYIVVVIFLDASHPLQGRGRRTRDASSRCAISWDPEVDTGFRTRWSISFGGPMNDAGKFGHPSTFKN